MTTSDYTIVTPTQSAGIPVTVKEQGRVIASFPHRGCGGSDRLGVALDRAEAFVGAMERPTYRDGSLLHAVLLGTRAAMPEIAPLGWLATMLAACEDPDIVERIGPDDPDAWIEMCSEVRDLVAHAHRALGLAAVLAAMDRDGLARGEAPTAEGMLRYAKVALGPSEAEAEERGVAVAIERDARWANAAPEKTAAAFGIVADALRERRRGGPTDHQPPKASGLP